MEYAHKLLPAEVVSVYNNLIVDAKLENGQTVAAFCGAVEIAGMCKPGTPLLLKRTSQQKRLVKYNISFVKTPEGIVFANPKYNRQLFAEAFDNGVLTDLAEYTSCRPLSAADNVNGLDFELTGAGGKKCFVFVTSVYNKQDGCAVFPHSINFFEIKMLEEMKKKKAEGAEVYIFMIAPREDCIAAKFIWNLDARAAAALFEAAKGGLNFLCYGCKITKNEIKIDRKMEILY